MPINYILWLAIVFAGVFFVLCWWPHFKVRPLIKATMAMLLAVYCFKAEAFLVLMAIGFGLSALGDFFLDLRREKWFLPGLIAFFAAHVAFAVYLFGHMVALSMFTPIEWGMCTGLVVLTIGFNLWLRPALSKDMKIPVAAYSLIITIMGITALTTTLPSRLVPIGALLFIASDVILATERFKFKFPLDKQINWALYASGQILLAVGVTTIL